jgi:hypothetical protein
VSLNPIAGSPVPIRLTEPSVDLGSVGHALPEYLPRSATFIYTILRFQTGYRPVVLARRTTNVDEFRLKSPVFGLEPVGPFGRRVAGRARALAHGYPGC